MLKMSRGDSNHTFLYKGVLIKVCFDFTFSSQNKEIKKYLGAVFQAVLPDVGQNFTNFINCVFTELRCTLSASGVQSNGRRFESQ